MSEILLLINPAKGYVFPFSSRGLSRITAPVQKFLKLAEMDIFLNGSGELLKINTAIPSHTGLFNKVKFALRLPVAGDIGLVPLDMTFPGFQKMFVDTLKRNRADIQGEDETWWLNTDPLDEVCDKVKSTRDFGELYFLMDFPADEDCLDLL